MTLMNSELPPTSPIRLGLALSYAVYAFEMENDKRKALDIAHSAFDNAIDKLDEIEK